MALLLDGVKIPADDDMTRLSDRKLRQAINKINGMDRPNSSQMVIRDTAQTVLDARADARRRSNGALSGQDLTYLGVDELSAKIRTRWDKLTDRAKARRAEAKPPASRRRNPSPPSGEPF